MPQTLNAQDSMERAVYRLLVDKFVLRDGTVLADHEDQVGSDFSFNSKDMPWYIRIDRIPGGRAGRHESVTLIELEVFGEDYLLTESVALDLEALMLGTPHTVVVDGRRVTFDSISQNVGVADLPWGDDSTYRLGATYVITARR